MGKKLLHSFRAEKISDDDMRTAALGTVETHRWQWLDRLYNHAECDIIE